MNEEAEKAWSQLKINSYYGWDIELEKGQWVFLSFLLFIWKMKRMKKLKNRNGEGWRVYFEHRIAVKDLINFVDPMLLFHSSPSPFHDVSIPTNELVKTELRIKSFEEGRKLLGI